MKHCHVSFSIHMFHAKPSISHFHLLKTLDVLMFAKHISLGRLAGNLDVIGTDEDNVDANEKSGKLSLSKKVLIKLIAEQFTRKPSQVTLFKKMPLFPTERMLWDTNLLPPSTFHHEHVLALPKLSLQYLTLHDYLLRNYNLFSYESAHTIREDLEDSVEFTSQTPTALPIGGFNLTEVSREKVGESCPSFMRSEIEINIRSLDAATRAQ
ncbi:putative RNA helicase aquarius [Blattamonas nauphoetae]|uniref:RNA helicase aquarius n=1 Tax=Blattamonas nauphoetae TaxID=2049346 RepID=A0ABQ9WNR2_9EUKA|nr:putative RNA helicase aquarius [Blattamonas nauphoetae]